MKNSGKGFNINKNFVGGLLGKFERYRRDLDVDMLRKMNHAVTVVYSVAHAKRPYITQAEAKAQGRSHIRGSKKLHVVSDPNEKHGVPVAQIDGGSLQASLKKEVQRKSNVYVGIISTDSPYASYLEFGTSRMAARPFMRPAMLETKESLKKIFKVKPVSSFKKGPNLNTPAPTLHKPNTPPPDLKNISP